MSTEFQITKYVGETPIYQTPLKIRLKFRRTEQPAILCLLPNVGSRHQKTIMYTKMDPQHTAPICSCLLWVIWWNFWEGKRVLSGKSKADHLACWNALERGMLIGPHGLKCVNKLATVCVGSSRCPKPELFVVHNGISVSVCRGLLLYSMTSMCVFV